MPTRGEQPGVHFPGKPHVSILPVDTLTRAAERLPTPGENPVRPIKPTPPKPPAQPATLVNIYPSTLRYGKLHIDLRAIPQDRHGQIAIINLLGNTIHSQRFTGGQIIRYPAIQFLRGIYFIRVDLEGRPLRTARLVVDR